MNRFSWFHVNNEFYLVDTKLISLLNTNSVITKDRGYAFCIGAKYSFKPKRKNSIFLS